jgi:hypothetical protein
VANQGHPNESAGRACRYTGCTKGGDFLLDIGARSEIELLLHLLKGGDLALDTVAPLASASCAAKISCLSNSDHWR